MEKHPELCKPSDAMSREEIGEAIEVLKNAIRVGEHTVGRIRYEPGDFIEPSKLEVATRMRDEIKRVLEHTVAKKSALERATAEWVDKLDQDPLPELPQPESPLPQVFQPEVPAPELLSQLDEDRRKKRLLDFTGNLTPANAPAGPTQSLVDVQRLSSTTDSANKAATFTFRGPPSLRRFFENGWATAAAECYRPSTPSDIDQEVEIKSPGVCPGSPDTREPRLRRSKRRLPAAAADVSVSPGAPTQDPHGEITPADSCPNTESRREATDMAEDPTTQMRLEVISLHEQHKNLREEMCNASLSLRIRHSRRTKLPGVTRNDTRIVRILKEDAEWSFERIHAYCKGHGMPNITMGQLEYICSELFPDPFGIDTPWP